ncbi:MAG: M50 family metallopeptidase [Armatimonadota bacterium]
MEKNAGRTLLIVAGVVSLVIWVIPAFRFILWPLTLFNTFIHELSHAAMTVCTGGMVESISINRTGSGVTLTLGGIGFLIASAGYLGSAVVGGAVLALARTRQSARVVCYVLCLVLVTSLVLVVRGDPVGWAVGLAWAAILGVSSRIMPAPWLIFFTRFLGFQLALTALHSLSDLLIISTDGSQATDAANIQAMTGIPALATSLVWALASLACIGFAIHRAWKTETAEQGYSEPARATRP